MKHALAKILFGSAILAGGVGGSLAQGIPGGATSLNETHGDWTVSCTAGEGSARCTISQVQVQGESRQRVLAIELFQAADGNGASGTLLLPFGLRLDDGVTVGLDEGQPFRTLRFSTCLPTGCLVPISFDASAVSALGSSGSLKIKATANDSSEEVALSVSMRGFSSALARLAQLTGS